jgi:hypothetical protein
LAAAASALGAAGTAWADARADAHAQVQGVAALVRAGQTFITWKDSADDFGERPVTWGELRDRLGTVPPPPPKRDSPIFASPLRGVPVKIGTVPPRPAVRYRVYRHTRPIDAKTLSAAVLLAEVQPFSGFNTNGWSLERLINQLIFSNEDRGEMGVYGFFEGWSRASPQAGKLVTGRLAIEDGKALPPGTGLFVYSPVAAGRAYYAVTAVADGVENRADFSTNVTAAIEENPARWQPVRQPSEGSQFGFDFRGERQFYVAWAGPPLAPRQGMYFNWSVHLPAIMRDEDFPGSKRLPVELYFHGPGFSYARPPVKFLEHSIQIAPHDFPFSGWYGYHEAADGTGAVPFSSNEDHQGSPRGVVRAYTQRRIAAFLDWAEKKFPIDPERVIAVGGDGAGLTALYQPQRFAYVLITGFEAGQLNPKLAAAYAAPWGPKCPEIKDEHGRGAWAWGELDVLLAGKPLPAVLPKDAAPPAVDRAAPGWKLELPLFVQRGGTWGRDPGYARGRGRFLYALQGTGHALYGHWAWGGTLRAPAKYTGLWQDLDLTNLTPIPAITGSRLDKEGEGEGHCNAGYTWQPVKDEARSVEITIAGRESTFDLTPRRLRNFKIAPGQKIAYEIVASAPAHGKLPDEAARPQTGQIAADANGLVTLRGVRIVKGSPSVTVTLRTEKIP